MWSSLGGSTLRFRLWIFTSECRAKFCFLVCIFSLKYHINKYFYRYYRNVRKIPVKSVIWEQGSYAHLTVYLIMNWNYSKTCSMYFYECYLHIIETSGCMIQKSLKFLQERKKAKRKTERKKETNKKRQPQQQKHILK